MNKLEKEFIPYEQALALKELGFNKPCFGLYHNDKTFYPTQCKSHDQFHGQVCLAPLYQQVFRWFREKYQMIFCYEPCLKKDLTYIFFIYIEKTGEKVFVVESKYDEQAELACLNKLIEICKNEQ
jgi:hypothetical protein